MLNILIKKFLEIALYEIKFYLSFEFNIYCLHGFFIQVNVDPAVPGVH